MALLAAAFLPPAIPRSLLGHDLAYAPLLVTCVLLSLGTLIVFPFEMDTIANLARDRLVATHYGLCNTIVGVGILVGNLFTGSVLNWADASGHPALPWLGLTVIGAASAATLYTRQGRSTSSEAEPSPQRTVRKASTR